MDDQISNSWHSRPDAAEMVASITKLLMAFRDRPTDPKALVTIYCEEFASLGAGFIEQVCGKFIKGKVEGHNMAFAPSVAEFWAVVDRIRDDEAEHERLMRRAEMPLIEDRRPPMPKIERGYHPSWELLAAKPLPYGLGGVSEKMAPFVGRKVEPWVPRPLDSAELEALPDAKLKRRGEAA